MAVVVVLWVVHFRKEVIYLGKDGINLYIEVCEGTVLRSPRSFNRYGVRDPRRVYEIRSGTSVRVVSDADGFSVYENGKDIGHISVSHKGGHTDYGKLVEGLENMGVSGNVNVR